MLGDKTSLKEQDLLEGHLKIHVVNWGAWVAQLVKGPTLVQVIISQFVGSSPTWGSVLTTQSLEPALDSVSPSLSAPNPLAFCLCLSQNK